MNHGMHSRLKRAGGPVGTDHQRVGVQIDCSVRCCIRRQGVATTLPGIGCTRRRTLRISRVRGLTAAKEGGDVDPSGEARAALCGKRYEIACGYSSRTLQRSRHAGTSLGRTGTGASASCVCSKAHSVRAAFTMRPARQHCPIPLRWAAIPLRYEDSRRRSACGDMNAHCSRPKARRARS